MKTSTNAAIKWLNANAKKHPEWLNPDEFYFDYPEYAEIAHQEINENNSSEMNHE